ncbi:hypothetical protein E2562_001614 [Oryza meyeriana var. granulata]|uniref:Uncharacterized protein n=1 Tax=Oryza meyeriana var. granulata TaxID=110450 RepID=A0A6G1CE59_9ORYZ|nr:hypothetical protein E2562_001614 [Oryza meyeriana var. granulata]
MPRTSCDLRGRQPVAAELVPAATRTQAGRSSNQEARNLRGAPELRAAIPPRHQPISTCPNLSKALASQALPLPQQIRMYKLLFQQLTLLCKGGITRIKLHLAYIPKCNVAKCKRVPADVKAEMIELLAKKNIVKENKTKEWKRARDEVNLDHSEGEASSEEEGGNSVVVVHSGRVGSTSSSKGGPMERFCKSTPEEVVAAKKGASLSNKQMMNKKNQKTPKLKVRKIRNKMLH